jgi:hypothetical protein
LNEPVDLSSSASLHSSRLALIKQTTIKSTERREGSTVL